MTRERPTARWLPVAAISVALGCGSGGDGPGRAVVGPDSPLPVSSVPESLVREESFRSAITGIEYPIHVYVPPGYEEGAARYPVIYATDGQWIFRGFSEELHSRGLEVILVAIEQGPWDRRWVDYTWPGARDYFGFLTTELIPHIESRYRIAPDDRTLSGTSLGGLLVGLVLLMEDVSDPSFRNYLSFDGSFYLHPEVTVALERDRFAASSRMDATLVLTSALLIGNDPSVTSFERMLAARSYSGLRIVRLAYSVVHDAVAQPSFQGALDVVFD